MKKTPLAIAIGLVASTMLAGCGGDSSDSTTGSGSTPPASSTYGVTAIDGYLQNAEVWLDINKNYQWDEGEPRKKTGEGGKAELNVTDIQGKPEDYPLVVKAIAGETIDEDNPDVPIPDGFMLSAPSGKDVVSPLTTLVDIKMRRDNISEDEATEAVAEIVGVDKTLVLSDFGQDKESTEAKIAQQTAKSLVSAGAVPKDEEELAKDADGSSSDDIIKGAEDVGTALQQDRENSSEDYDYNKVVNKDGIVDTDTDGDGVPDADDAFAEDKTESKDSDGDKVGDNADLFDDDPTEWADKDGDKVGDNTDLFDDDPNEWADNDGDNVGDNADLFDDDPNEWADNDGDNVGDNADVFDDDPNEWADRDGDKVGDNSDIFPDDPNEWADDDNDGIGNNTDIDNIPVSEKTPSDFLAANNRFAVFEFDSDDLYYQDISWSSIDYSTTLSDFIFDSELNTFVVDDEEESGAYLLTSGGEWKHITDEGFKLIPQPDGSLIDQNISTGEEQTATGHELRLEGRNVLQVLQAKGGASDTVLKIPADITFSTGATALELTWKSQTVNYELSDWECHEDNLPQTNLGFTNCNTVYQFRGGNDGPAETLASLVVESAGETGNSSDFRGFSALMESVSTQLYADNTGAFYQLSWSGSMTYERLSTNLSWSEKTVHGQTLYVLQTSEPAYQEHINNAFFVELEGYVRMGYKIDDTQEEETILLFNDIAEQDILNAIGAIELPETLTATCGEVYDYPPSSSPLTAVPQAYLDAIAACNTRPLPAESFNNGSRFIRLSSTGEPRAFEFHDNGSWTYYKRGIERGTHSYKADTANPQVLLMDKGGNEQEFSQEFVAYAVTDYALDMARNILVFEQFPGEEGDPEYPDPNLYYATHWPSIIYSYSNEWMERCETSDSGWDNTNEQPLVPRTAAEFEQAVEDCQTWWGNRRPKFTVAMLKERKLVIDSEEYIQFPNEDTLPATFFDGSESTSINWSIDEQGRLQLSSINQSYQASESWVISDTDGVKFSAKVFHKNSDFSNTTDDQGEIWSTMFHLE